ncbi:MAG: nucleotide exchange factor GrpE [Bacillota bacterium]
MTNSGYEAAQGEIKALRRALEEERNRHLRTMADFENYRRRIERDVRSLSEEGKKELIRDLLVVLDNMERAFGQSKDPYVLHGLQMIYRQFVEVLGQHGLEPVESAGRPFDPGEHEGIGYVEDTGYAPGHVVQELRRGYRFGGELLRPATVRVAAGQVNKQYEC